MASSYAAITFILGLLAVIAVGYAYNEYTKKEFIRQTRSRWEQVQWGPVGVLCYGIQPKSLYNGAHFGAIGIVNHKLVFLGHRNSSYDFEIPLEQIRGLASCVIRVQAGKTSVQKNAVEIHAEKFGQWVLYIFTQFYPDELLDQIKRHAERTIPDRMISKQITPTHAHRMNQDVYGQWVEDYNAPLYLAPDRIIFDWRSLIEFVQIRRIEVFERGGLNSLNPFAQELVRIEYSNGDGKFQVIGFLLRGAESWAESLSNHTNIRVELHFGRKKKDD